MARLDAAMVQQGLVPSRQRAKTLIQNGQISVNGKVCTKPAFAVEETDQITMEGSDIPFVGRGGLNMRWNRQSVLWTDWSVWISAHLPAALRTVCYSVAQQRFTPLTWDTDSWCSRSGKIHVW